MKILLTICLLLITSQVFAKKITVYDCQTMADAMSCNNCKKKQYVNVKVNANKVLMQYIYKDDSGESITNDYLQTVKHEDFWIRKNTNMATLHTEKETLDVFDENNWEYLNTSNVILASTHKITTDKEIEKSMVNGKYYEMFRFYESPARYRCGK